MRNCRALMRFIDAKRRPFFRCPRCLTKRTAFSDGPLCNSRISAKTFLKLIYLFCWNIDSYETIQREVGKREGRLLSSATIAAWTAYFRRLITDDLLANARSIGGPGLTVQVDETCFYKRKYNVGRLTPQTWLVGGYCVETDECFLYRVIARDIEQLWEAVNMWVVPGSRMVTDEWRAYRQVAERLGVVSVHDRVNHRENFVDPVTGAHTNNIEGLWSVLKRWMRRRGLNTGRRANAELYVGEFLWKRTLGNRTDRTKAFLRMIRRTFIGPGIPPSSTNPGNPEVF